MPATACASVPSPPCRRSVVAARSDAELRTGLVELVPQLRVRALRLCGDATTAEDVVQDTIERALRFSHQYERGTNLRAWAMQVLFSVFVTRWRRRRRERSALTRLAIDPCAWTVPAAFAAPDAGDGALTPATRRTLETLPAGFRAVIILVDLEQRTYADAAGALGVPVGTVMSRLHRGRKLLAEKMSEAA
jgi:RNA polymerase sigma-70 factor (ECF subfamily)